MQQRSQKQRITVVDVAKLAGVSPMTVSRVLNTPESVPAATVERVRSAVVKLGYVKNRLAGGLRSSRSHLVAAVVPTLSGPVFLDTIESLNAGLARRGYHLVVGQSGYGDSREDELLSDVLSRRPDAIVVTGTMHSAASKRILLSAGIPVIEFWDLADDPIDLLIGFSHEAVGAAVSQFFSDSGRRHLGLIAADDVRSRRRWASYQKRSAELGLRPPRVRFVSAPARLGDGRRALRELIAEAPDLDAIFCSSDMLASGVIIEAKVMGMSVGGQLGVVGFGDLNFAADLDPPLTTVRVDAPLVGELIADTLVRCLNGEPVAQRIVDVGFRIVRRGSA